MAVKYIHFIGKLRDLKPMGFVFQRLFARNYRCWHWHVDPEGFGDSLWVWDKGKEVEVKDLHDLSYLIVEELVIKGRQGHRIKPDGKLFFNEPTHGSFILDIDTHTLIDYSYERSGTYLFRDPKKDPSDEEVKAYHDRYREVRIDDALVEKLRELLDKGMIEIAERNNP